MWLQSTVKAFIAALWAFKENELLFISILMDDIWQKINLLLHVCLEQYIKLLLLSFAQILIMWCGDAWFIIRALAVIKPGSLQVMYCSITCKDEWTNSVTIYDFLQFVSFFHVFQAMHSYGRKVLYLTIMKILFGIASNKFFILSCLSKQTGFIKQI